MNLFHRFTSLAKYKTIDTSALTEKRIPHQISLWALVTLVIRYTLLYVNFRKIRNPWKYENLWDEFKL